MNKKEKLKLKIEILKTVTKTRDNRIDKLKNLQNNNQDVLNRDIVKLKK